MVNKWTDSLKEEKSVIADENPFSKGKKTIKTKLKNKQIQNKSYPHISKKEKSANYFSLILTSDFEDLEMDIRGIREYKEYDKLGKFKLVFKRRPNHFLSEEGAENLLLELRTHLNPDIKLAISTREEFLMTQDIIRKHLLSFVANELYSLGMDTEEKQRNAPILINRILLRIRAVYSRSIAGLENERSHGDIKLSGDLDIERDNKFRLEEMKN